MLRGEVRAIASTDLACYDYLAQRIKDLELEEVRSSFQSQAMCIVCQALQVSVS